MFSIAGIFVVSVVLGATAAEPAKLAFQPAEAGYYQFDTGTLRGKMRVDGKSQGISSLVHVPSSAEIAKLPGLLSYYRTFSTNKRYGQAARDWPVHTRLLPDGALEMDFPPAEEHPLRLRGVCRWVAADTVDLETTLRPAVAMPRCEVFLSSYVGKGFDGLVYLKPNRVNKKDSPALLRADWSPLVDGNYLMFPRDLAATQIIYDGRWEYPPSPVQWAVGRYLAGPLAVRRDEASGLAVVLMAPADDCFAVAMPYNKTPPDNIANHSSMYLSLCGRDVAPDEEVKVRCRIVVKKDLTDAAAIELYQEYLRSR